MIKNPVDNFIEFLRQIDEKAEDFYSRLYQSIDKHLGERYEGGHIERYLTDIEHAGYKKEDVKEYLIECAKRVDRTDRSEE